MALYDFVKSLTKSSLLAHLKNIDQKTMKWRKDLLDAVVTKDELEEWSSGGGVDHGALTGLGDDDHTQYIIGDRDDWTDLTDGGATTLHKHDHGGQDGLADDDHTQYVLRSQWKQNGFVSKDDITISWSDANRALTVTKTGANFVYFEAGVAYTKTDAQTKQIDDTEGLWIFYFDGATLTAANSPSDADIEHVIENHTIVAYVYWDATNNDGRLFAEPHGSNMSPSTHHYLHDVLGSQYDTGMALGDILADEDGSSNTHAQFSTEAGAFYDEDVKHTTELTAAATGLEIYYFDGSDLRWTTNSGYSFITYSGGSGRIAYNNSGAQAEVDNTKFVLAHVFASNIKDDDGTNYRLIAVQGQAQYATLALARDGANTEIFNLLTGDLPMQELVPVATVIFQTADAYTNDVNARIRSTDTGDDYIDWRTSLGSGVGGSTTTNDHGLLSGLSDDDHTQYILANGTRALTADWDAGSFEIRAQTLESDVATGTAPLTVASTTAVTNLNADMLDGIHNSELFHNNIRAEINAITEKSILEDGDIVLIEDSYDDPLQWVKKKAQLQNIAKYVSEKILANPLLIDVYNNTGSQIDDLKICYVSGDSSGTPLITLADASAESTASKMLCIASGNIANASSGKAIVYGFVSGLSGLTASAIQYLSTTAGSITETAPSASGEIVRIVGYAMSTTKMFFSPDPTYLELA